MPTTPTTRYLTPPQLARLLGVEPAKIIGWIRSGELAALNVAASSSGKRARWRISAAAVEAFERRRAAKVAPHRRPRRRPPDDGGDFF